MDKRGSTGDEGDDDSSTEKSSGIKRELKTIVHEAVSESLSLAMVNVEKKLDKLIHTYDSRLSEIENGIAYRDGEFKDLQCTTDSLLDKLKETEGRVLRCEKLIVDLQEENISLKCRSMRDNLVFYNIVERNDRPQYEDTRALLYGFVHAELKIDEDCMSQIHFDRVHRMGTKQPGRNRPIVAKCLSSNTKDIILRHARNLKGTTFGISEQLPQEVNERRNHLMPKLKEAKKANIPTKWNVDKLYVNGVMYAQPKDQTEFVNAPPSDTAIDIRHTDIEQEKGSSFQAHIIKLEDKAQVIPTLHKLYTNQNVAKATHNMYAYRLRGQSLIVENSSDDGEFGAGRNEIAAAKRPKC